MTQSELTEITRHCHDLVETATGTQRKAIEQMEKRLREFGTAPRGRFGVESAGLGEQFTESSEYKAFIAAQAVGTMMWHTEGKAVSTVILGAPPTSIAEVSYAGPALLPQFPASLRSLIPSRPMGSEVVLAIREEGSEGTAGLQCTEGGAKSQIDMKFVPETIKLCMFNAYTKVSVQCLQDLGWVRDAIESNILVKIGQKEDLEWVTQLNAAATAAPAPVAGDTPLDAVAAAQDSLTALGWAVSGTIVNPADIGKIRRVKDVNKNYIPVPPWIGSIVPTPAQPAGTFLTGAFSTATVILDRDMVVRIEMGVTNDDFIKNLRVILGERRSALWIGQKGGFAKGALSAAAAMEI